jgi:hypothetical protein
VEHKGESTFFSVLVGERHFSSVEVRGALTPRDACEERPTAVFRTHWLIDRPLPVAGARVRGRLAQAAESGHICAGTHASSSAPGLAHHICPSLQ